MTDAVIDKVRELADMAREMADLASGSSSTPKEWDDRLNALERDIISALTARWAARSYREVL